MLKAKSQFEDEFNDKVKVKSFLDSIGRNSIKSRSAYLAGIRHFENFIVQTYGQYNCETILEPLTNNQINVYEMFDSFVSYIPQERNGINPKTIRLYVAAIRSYLAYYDIDVLPSKFKRKEKSRCPEYTGKMRRQLMLLILGKYYWDVTIEGSKLHY